MELLHPGVYIQEVPSGVRPIEGVSTSTAAFLGKAARGPLDRAVMVTSFIEFQALYGGFLNDSYLAHAAFQFFNNGGRRLYVLRVAQGAATADIGIADREAAPERALTISASSPGAWGNELEVVIADGTADPGDEFKLSIQQGGAVVEVHDNLSANPDALNFADNVVNARSRLVRLAVVPTNDSNVAGTSTSGTAPATSLPADRRRLRIDVNGDGPQTITLADPVTTGAQIATALQGAVQALTPLRSSARLWLEVRDSWRPLARCRISPALRESTPPPWCRPSRPYGPAARRRLPRRRGRTTGPRAAAGRGSRRGPSRRRS